MSSFFNSKLAKFSLVALGALLIIGAVVGGAIALNGRGLLDSLAEVGPGDGRGERLDGDFGERPSAPFVEGEFSTRPERGGHHEAGDFNTRSLMGLLKVVGQLALVILIVAGGAKLISSFTRRIRGASTA